MFFTGCDIILNILFSPVSLIENMENKILGVKQDVKSFPRPFYTDSTLKYLTPIQMKKALLSGLPSSKDN